MPDPEQFELPGMPAVPHIRTRSPEEMLGEALADLVRKEQRIEQLQDELRNKTYLQACLLHLLGGEAKITREWLDTIPTNGVMHEEINTDTETLTLRFVLPEDN
jgi:hypothetical protein